ncbi:MAG: hypothetical protein ACI9B9_000891 [Halioglobus sp.]|jgi:hypothetical protein
MSIKDSNSDNIDSSRRGFSKLGVALPVIMTLASKPVLGGTQCLSNALSGNLSDPTRGNCNYGWSPGGWKTSGGSPDWSRTLFEYSDFDESDINGNKRDKHKAASYTGGTTLGQTVLAGLQGGAYDDQTLTGLLWEFPGNSGAHPVGHMISALLNASCSDIEYALTEDQLVDLILGHTDVPGGMSLTAYLDTTWN